MKKFIEWMHGKGRSIVMLVVALVALSIVLHYFVVERDCYIGPGKPNPTTSPKTKEELNLGGDSIGPAPTETPDWTKKEGY